MGAVIDVALADPPSNEMFAHEQKQAIADLLRHNVFTLRAHARPTYRVDLAQTASAVTLTVRDEKSALLEEIGLSAPRLARLLRQYRQACAQYYSAVQGANAPQMEAFDAERRNLHDTGAKALQSQLDDAIEMDLETARRFFTLLASLRQSKLGRAGL